MSERLKRITELYGASLKEFLQDSLKSSQEDSYWKYFSKAEMVERFASFDPSRNKSATQWLITTYLNKGFLLEDLPKAYETLLVFSQVKRLLPVNQRSLNGYKTLASVWKVIEEAGLLNSSSYWVEKMGSTKDNLTSKEEKKAEKEKAYEESHVVYQDENLEVVVPLTEFAAKWHGRGTRWCTSADKHNRFHQYNKDAPLIIIKERLGSQEGGNQGSSLRKSQLWIIGNTIQFMDANDDRIENIDAMDMRFPVLKFFIKLNPSVLNLFSIEDCFSLEEIIELLYVPQTLPFLKKVIDKHWDFFRNRCLEIVLEDPSSIVHLPWQKIDEDFIHSMMEKNNFTLKFINVRLQTWDMCVAALRINPLGTINHINELFIRQHYGEIVHCLLTALKGDVEQCENILINIPEDLLGDNSTESMELCREAVKRNTKAILCVPEHYINNAMMEDAIKKDYMALLLLNWDFSSRQSRNLYVKMAQLAVKSNGKAIQCLNRQIVKEEPDIFNRELFLQAIKDGGHLVDVPERLRNKAICREAIKRNGDEIQNVPNKLKSHFYLEAVQQNAFAIWSIPDDGTPLYQKVCNEAVKKSPNIIERINPRYITRKMIRGIIADKSSHLSLRYVPHPDTLPCMDETLLREFYQEADRRNLHPFMDIPSEFITMDEDAIPIALHSGQWDISILENLSHHLMEELMEDEKNTPSISP